MSGAVVNLILDVLIVVLLVVTIGYCWVLNRRIKVLQDSKGELALLLKRFDESTQRASESIIALQTASKKIGENIQFRIDKANYMLDDLSFMIERGNKLANQMEAGMAVTRARTRTMHEPAAQNDDEVMVQEKPVAKPVEKPQNMREKTSASLEAMLERVVGRAKQVEESKPERPAAPAMRPRSQAEQELLDIIKAGIKG
jgi:hypothetical protein